MTKPPKPDTAQASAGAPAQAGPARGWGFYFWATILALLAISLAAVTIALIRTSGVETAATQPPAFAPAPPAPRSLTQEQLAGLVARARQHGLRQIEAAIDPQLDRIFDPVHAAIPAYADFHYSVWGQYAELGAAVIEQEVGSLMRDRLFGGFEQRHASAMAALHATYISAVRDAFAGASQVGPGDAPWSDSAQTVLRDTRRRLTIAAPAGAVSAIAAGSIAAPVAAKIVASTAAKAAAKGVGKVAGIGSGAAAGAAAGSLLGPVGAVAGGAGGAIITWLAVDYAAVKLDEYFNRDMFEAELRAAIDAEKARLRRQVLAAYAMAEP